MTEAADKEANEALSDRIASSLSWTLLFTLVTCYLVSQFGFLLRIAAANDATPDVSAVKLALTSWPMEPFIPALALSFVSINLALALIKGGGPANWIKRARAFLANHDISTGRFALLACAVLFIPAVFLLGMGKVALILIPLITVWIGGAWAIYRSASTRFAPLVAGILVPGLITATLAAAEYDWKESAPCLPGQTLTIASAERACSAVLYLPKAKLVGVTYDGKFSLYKRTDIDPQSLLQAIGKEHWFIGPLAV